MFTIVFGTIYRNLIRNIRISKKYIDFLEMYRLFKITYF